MTRKKDQMLVLSHRIDEGSRLHIGEDKLDIIIKEIESLNGFGKKIMINLVSKEKAVEFIQLDYLNPLRRLPEQYDFLPDFKFGLYVPLYQKKLNDIETKLIYRIRDPRLQVGRALYDEDDQFIRYLSKKRPSN